MKLALLLALLAADRGSLSDIRLTDAGGEPFAFPKAPVWVIAVWSSNCGSCSAQLANVDALARAFEADRQVSFFAVDVDNYVGGGGEPPKVSFPVLEDPKARLARTIEAWGQKASAVPTTVTMPAVYVVDEKGHTRADLKYYRDLKPEEFVEKYRPVLEQAKAGALAGGSSGTSVTTTIEQESRDVAISRGHVRLKYPQMSEAQIARTLPDVRKQLAQTFPRATPAQLDEMLAKVEAAMKKGEPVDLDTP